MHFCLIRHAEAEPVELASSRDDSQRALTETGLAQCQTLSLALNRMGIELGTVVTSPYLRALQTAKNLLEHWPHPLPRLVTCDHLAPGGKFKKLNRTLNSLESDVVTLVGHMPDLALYAAWLIGSKKAQITLSKAGVAWIDCETGPIKGGGILTWLVSPSWYQHLK